VLNFSIFFDTDQLRFSGNHPVALDRSERLAHGVLGGGIGDEDYRDRRGRAAGNVAAMRPLAAVTLHDRFERDVLLGKA